MAERHSRQLAARRRPLARRRAVMDGDAAAAMRRVPERLEVREFASNSDCPALSA